MWERDKKVMGVKVYGMHVWKDDNETPHTVQLIITNKNVKKCAAKQCARFWWQQCHTSCVYHAS
jgi:hypothetical protein